MAAAAPPYWLTIEHQLYAVGIGCHIYRLAHSSIIVPMAYYIGMVTLWLYPSVPHYLMNIEGILRYAHGIGDTTGTIVDLATPVGIGIREDNLRTTRVYPLACTGTLQPIVVPSFHHCLGKDVHIVVIIMRRLATVQRTITFLVERVAILIPVLTQSLVTMVLHLPHRVLRALVDIKHLSTIFRLIDVKHLTATYGTSTIRVVLVTYGL